MTGTVRLRDAFASLARRITSPLWSRATPGGCGRVPTSIELAIGELAAAADLAATLTALAEWMKRHEDERIVALLTREADEQSEDGFPMAAAFAAHLAKRVHERTVGAPTAK